MLTVPFDCISLPQLCICARPWLASLAAPARCLQLLQASVILLRQHSHMVWRAGRPLPCPAGIGAGAGKCQYGTRTLGEPLPTVQAASMPGLLSLRFGGAGATSGAACASAGNRHSRRVASQAPQKTVLPVCMTQSPATAEWLRITGYTLPGYTLQCIKSSGQPSMEQSSTQLPAAAAACAAAAEGRQGGNAI